jgi:hypothetical protein
MSGAADRAQAIREARTLESRSQKAIHNTTRATKALLSSDKTARRNPARKTPPDFDALHAKLFAERAQQENLGDGDVERARKLLALREAKKQASAKTDSGKNVAPRNRRIAKPAARRRPATGEPKAKLAPKKSSRQPTRRLRIAPKPTVVARRPAAAGSARATSARATSISTRAAPKRFQRCTSSEAPDDVFVKAGTRTP